MSALKNGDVIALYLDDDDDKLGAKLGYLGSDPTALSSVTATIEEELLVVPMVHTPTGPEYPSSFQSRCLFRIDIGRRESFGTDLLYGQSVVLTHVNTEMLLTATSQEDVRLASTRGTAAYFSVEPRYKLRSEGEKVYAGDHILLQSRRYAGCYLHSTSLGPPEDAPGGKARPTSAGRAPSPRAPASEVEGKARRGTVEKGHADASHAWQRDGVRSYAGPHEAQVVDLYNLKSGQGWVVQRFAPFIEGDDDAASRTLRGGDSVRLFHREAEGYLISLLDTEWERHPESDGTLDDILAKDSKGEDFIVRLKPSNFMKRSSYSTSVVSVWQVQLTAVQLGEPVTWGTPCRFRHSVCGRYLCVHTDAAGKLTLSTTASRHEPSNIFKLLSMSAEEDAAGVTATSFVRVLHRDSKRFLVLDDTIDFDEGGSLVSAKYSGGGGDGRRGSGSDRGSKLGARTEKSSGKGKTQDKELKKLALVTESSGKDVFSLQPVHDGSLASLHRVQRLLAVVKRFMTDLQSQGRSADEKSKTPPATPGGAAGLTSMDAMAKAYGTPALRKRASRETATALTRPPDPAAVSKVYAVLAELCCVATQVKFVPGMDAFKIDEMPKKRAQNLLRSQLAIEYIVKLWSNLRVTAAPLTTITALPQVHRQARRVRVGALLQRGRRAREAVARRERPVARQVGSDQPDVPARTQPAAAARRRQPPLRRHAAIHRRCGGAAQAAALFTRDPISHTPHSHISRCC